MKNPLRRKPGASYPLLAPTSTHQYRLTIERYTMYFTSGQAANEWFHKQITCAQAEQARREAAQAVR